MEPSIMRAFDDFMATDTKTNRHLTPTKPSPEQYQTSRHHKHVKFMNFNVNHSNNPHKPKRQLEQSVILPSKHSVVTNPAEDVELGQLTKTYETNMNQSSYEERSMTPLSMRMTPPSKIHDETVIQIVEQDLSPTEELRLSQVVPPNASPKIEIEEDNLGQQLENEHEVKKNLDKITLSYAQTVEDYQNYTEDILKQLEGLEQKQDTFKKNCLLHKALFIGLQSSEILTPEQQKIYTEANLENKLDVEDLNELHKHKLKEFKKLENQLEECESLNSYLRKRLKDKLPNDEDEVYQRTDIISKHNRKEIQPQLGENEMLKLKLEGIQQKRRDIIFRSTAA